jgi:hypothetical protein
MNNNELRPSNLEHPEKMRLVDLMDNLTLGQICAGLGTLCAALASSFGLGVSMQPFMTRWLNSPKTCADITEYPLGLWNVTINTIDANPFHLSPKDFNKLIYINPTTKSGEWLSDNKKHPQSTLTLSDVPAPGKSITLVYDVPGGSHGRSVQERK